MMTTPAAASDAQRERMVTRNFIFASGLGSVIERPLDVLYAKTDQLYDFERDAKAKTNRNCDDGRLARTKQSKAKQRREYLNRREKKNRCGTGLPSWVLRRYLSGSGAPKPRVVSVSGRR